MILDFVRLKGKSICLRVITPHELEGGGEEEHALREYIGYCCTPVGIVLYIPISISFLKCISKQIVSHIQVESFCPEIAGYPVFKICK